MRRPPSLPRRLLERRLTEPTRTYLLGDLEERFRDLARSSPLRARLWYWRQALAALLLPVPGTLGVPRGGGGALGFDLRQASRALLRRPGTAIAAVLPLGLGIGVVATAFSIVWGTVLAGLPFEDADRLVHFERARLAQGETSLAVTPHDYLDWRSRQRSFEELGAYVEREAVLPTDAGPPERRMGVAISAGSFPLLRVDAVLGRTFGPADEEPGAPAVVVLSHRLWSARYGADPDIVGRSVVVSGRPTTVVGVMPEGFGFPIAEEFWVPLRIDPTALERGQGRLDVFGRLRDGISLDAARAEFEGITAGLADAHPETNAGITASLRSFEDEYVGEDFTSTVYRLLAGAILVLLVCCANVANLLLIRGFRRRRDLAVRRALGATRGGLVRQLLAESVVLAGAGAALGALLAAYGVAWFNRVGTGAGVFALPHGSDSLFWWNVGLNGPTVAVTAGVAALTAVLAGLVPAVRVATASELGHRGRGGGGPGGSRLQRGIVLSQLALTAGLLVAAGFVTRSVANVSGAAARFVPEDVLVLGLGLPTSTLDEGAAYDDPEAQARFVSGLEDRLAADPDVAATGYGTAVPLEAPASAPFRLDGAAGTPTDLPEAGVITVSPGYFRVFGVEPRAGRLFTAADRVDAPPVAVVNRRFAELYLGGRSPLGARLRLGGDEDAESWVVVIGVVPDLWERPGTPAEEAGIYLPVAQLGQGESMIRVGRWGLAYPTLAVRAARPGAVTATGLGTHVAALDASLPLRRLETMEELADRRLGRYRVWGRFWLAFAGAALLLAGLGIYGVLSFHVTLRTNEIGVRRALGASAASIKVDVIRRALGNVAVGGTVGLWLGSLLTSGLGHVLYGVEGDDPVVFASVALLIAGVAVVASWWPARRAARVDPRDAMRAD